MTSSSHKLLWALACWAAPLATAWAGLGEAQSSIDAEQARMGARQAVSRTAQYAVHELKMADGSRVQQYVAGDGRVFAVRWNTLYKPDLSRMLGTSFPDYHRAAHQAAQRGGIQRQFHHEGTDLVVQSNGHLHLYAGYAYRRSLWPQGLSPKSIGLG